MLAGITPGQQPIAPVLLKYLKLRQHHNLSGIAVDETYNLLPGMHDQTVEQRQKQPGGRRIEEEPRCAQVLVNIRFVDVTFSRLDFDSGYVLVHYLFAGFALAGALTAMDQGHDRVVLELPPRVVGTREIRLRDFVSCRDVELVAGINTASVENLCEVGRERPENEPFEYFFLFVHSMY